MGRSYINCGKERVSVYLAAAAQYIQLDPNSETLARWNVDQSSVAGSKSLGFAVTDEGKMYAGFAGFSGSDGKRRHGLYEMQPIPGSLIASVNPVEGTVTVFDPNDGVPEDTVERLWGADGNFLVITRRGDGWGLSWASVLATTASSN